MTIPADANTRGMWSPVYNWPGVPVHTVILSDGRLLTFGSAAAGQQGAANGYDIWDPTVAPDQGHLALPNNTGTDIFCSSALLLPPETPGSSGRVFVAGGDNWTGVSTTNTPNQNSNELDVLTGQLTRRTDLKRPRWYSTSVTLPNGETYIQGGNGGTDRPEIRGLSGAFRLLDGVDTSTLHFSFPRNFVAPDGRVFGFDTAGQMYYVNPAGTGTISFVGTLPTQYASDSGSAAMFAPGRILQLGGNSNGVMVIDITGGGTPVLTPTQSLATQRQWVNATLLADGKVLATSGSVVRDQLTGYSTRAEVWNPVTGQWMQGPSAVKPRLYHSNAILLPDGSVLVTAGGATSSDGSPGPADNLNAEIYYPPYFFGAGGVRAPRPIIATAPDWIDIGTVFPMAVENATSVSRVTMVKTGASTHSFNMDQRFVDLTFSAAGGNLQVQAPTRATDATPGYYMLFAFDQAGVPSVAKIVRVGIAAVPNPSLTPTLANPGAQVTDVGTPASLALVASDPNGDRLSFNATGLPAGMSLDPASGVISGTPNAAGTFNVVVTASDGLHFASANFTWTVNVVNGVVLGDLPVVSTSEAGATATFAVTSTGGTNVRYSWNFGDGTGDSPWSAVATISHSFANPGTYNVTVRATDDTQLIRTKSFLQTVALPPTAQAPRASSNIAVQSLGANGSRIWVVNPDNDSVTVFDGTTRAKLAEVAVGAGPRTLAISSSGQVWVTNKFADSISVIDGTTLTVVRTIAVPRGSQPFGITMTPSGTQAFAVLEAGGQLLRFDTATYSQTGSVAVGANARHVSVDASGSSVFVSRFISPPLPGESTATVTPTPSHGGEVVVISAAGMSFMRTIVLQHSDRPDVENQGRGIPNYLGAVAISPDGTQAWVPSKQDNVRRGTLRDGNALNFQNTVRAVSSRIVMATQQEDLAKRVDHDNSSVASAAVFDARGVYLFVALETSREVAVIDAHQGFQVMRFDVGRAPQGLALSPDGKTLYVHNFMDRSVGVFDLQPLLLGGQLSVPLVANLSAVGTESLPPAVLLGKQLFYDARDPRLSRDRYMSCAACHNDGGHDGRVWDLTGQGEGLRNTIALRGRSGAHGMLHWSGNFDEVQDFEGQIRGLAGGTGLMSEFSFAAGTRSQPLGDPKGGLGGDLDALASYVSSLATFARSPNRDATGALTTQGAAGRTVFETKGCSICHGGEPFTNSGLIGLRDVGTIKPASGKRLGAALTGLDIPTLRDVWATAPYLHDGSASTLEQAVLSHNNVAITQGELASLVQYLKELGSDEGPAPGPRFSGQIAAVSFDEGVGTFAADQAGATHGATLLNGATWLNGKYGSSASFDGVDDAAQLAAPSSIDLWNDFTLMLWVKRESLTPGPAQQRHIFSKCHGSAWQAGCKELYLYGNGQLRFGSFSGGDVTSVTIADTSWHHLAVTYSRSLGQLQIYVDGTLRTSVPYVLEADDTSHVVMLGNQGGNNPFSGQLDELRIYSSVLTAAQIVSDMNAPLAPGQDTTPPVLSGGAPTGTLAAGTTQTSISMATSENATCRYATVAATPYAAMTGAFSSTGGTSHSTVVGGLANGQNYSYFVRCQDAAGNANTTDLTISFAVAVQDATAPTVALSAPAAGATVSGTVTVSATASDNVGVVGVQFLVDGVALGAEDTTAPYTLNWNTATSTNGAHTVSARARDAAGNQTVSTPVSVTVSNAAADTTAPNVAMTAPAAGASVSGTVTVSANASDNVGVVGVQFLLDGAALGSEVTTAPYTLNWSTATTSNGGHTLSARARDAAGNQTVSSAVSVTVANSASPGLSVALALDETSGTSASDLSGNAHTGTLVNGPAWAVGKYGNALSFDGVNDALSLATPATVDLGSDFAVMMWAKRNALGGSGQRHLFSKCHSTAWQLGCKELYFFGNELRFGTYGTTDVIAGTVADTNWHHIAVLFTRATNQLRIYVDGTLRVTSTQNIEADAAGHVATVGNMHGANPFSGLIDDLRVYSQVLSAADVVSAMNTPLQAGPDTTPPVLSGASPSGTLAVGTTQATLGLTSSENATCRHATVAGTAFASMTGVFTTTGGTSHSTVVTGLANGQSYTYYVRCQDTAGNATTADLPISFSVAAPDTTAPTVNLTAPAAGASVSGTVAVSANASDNVGVVGVQFLLDGVALGAEDTAAPYTVNWTTTTATNGAHTLSARARDAAGNQTVSTVVSVTVANADTTAPTVNLTAPAAGASVSGTVAVSANASDNVGVVGVQFLLDGVALGAEVTAAPYTLNWNTTTATNGAHTVSARARDAAGNQTVSTVVSVTVSNAVPDTTAPTVSITAPSAGASVSGSVAVSASASDNVGVVGVQFLLDGAALGAEDTAAPYTVNWNTTTATNGAHTLSARARDAAGNQTVSVVASVTVSNAVPDTTAPTVSMSAPVAGATVSGTVAVSAGASDNVGVVGVQFLLDGVALGTEVTASPYTLNWNTTTATNGAHVLSARARDAAGNQTVSTAVSVTVSNAAPSGMSVALALNETSGTSAADLSGNGHTGTLVNGPAWAVGKYANALSFDGVNDSLSLALPSTVNLGANFTAMMWIKRNALGGGLQRHLFSKCHSTAWQLGCKEFYFYGNQLRFGTFGTTDVAAGNVADTNWHHVAVVFTRATNQVQIYVDGALRVTSTQNLEADVATHVMSVGNMHGSNPFSGLIDDFRIYGQSLTATQITSAMNTPL